MTTKEKIKVMQAFVDGKAIQIKSVCGVNDWTDYKGEPVWEWYGSIYRIKPGQKLRPYTFEEFLMAQKEHGMYLKWKNAEHESLYLPYEIRDIGVSFSPGEINYAYEDLLHTCTWQDNSPCGIMEE